MKLEEYPNFLHEWIERLGKATIHNNSQYTVVGADGQLKQDMLEGNQCTARMFSGYATRRGEYILFKLSVASEMTIGQMEYLQWLLNDSPLASHYITKESLEVDLTDCVVLDGTKSSTTLLMAIMAYRYLWEFPHIVDNWNKLTSLGMDKSDALILSHYISGQGDISVAGYNTNHYLMKYGSFTKESMGLFSQGVFPKIRGPFIEGKESGSVDGVYRVTNRLDDNLMLGLRAAIKGEESNGLFGSTVTSVVGVHQQVFDYWESIQ